jgi:hypothetical protein
MPKVGPDDSGIKGPWPQFTEKDARCVREAKGAREKLSQKRTGCGGQDDGPKALGLLKDLQFRSDCIVNKGQVAFGVYPQVCSDRAQEEQIRCGEMVPLGTSEYAIADGDVLHRASEYDHSQKKGGFPGSGITEGFCQYSVLTCSTAILDDDCCDHNACQKEKGESEIGHWRDQPGATLPR